MLEDLVGQLSTRRCAKLKNLVEKMGQAHGGMPGSGGMKFPF